MRRLTILFALAAFTVLLGATAAGATTTAHHPLYMPNASNFSNPALQPPPVCCLGLGLPPAGQPAPVNMAYFGGHVQVTPKIYLVFWGWGQTGAFDHTTPGMPTYDPDGAAARMTAFVKAMGARAGPVSRRSTSRRSTARTSTSRTRRTSSAVSGTTTRTRSTTT